MSVTSPCVNVCRMDASNAVCVGCFRTLDEIAQWSRASDGTKIAILAAVEQRRAGHASAADGLHGDTRR